MSANSTYVAPVLPIDGRLGHLTQEQTVKLQQFWVRLYDIFDGKTPFDQTAPSSFKGQAREDGDGETPAPAKTGWFGRGKAASESNGAVAAPRFTGAELHKTFWKLTMMDHPDLIVLKFIRARKWVLDDALKMFLNALKWRIVERLDELVELSDVELDAKYPKFIEQMRIGKGYLRGADPLGRPMSVVNTRLHHKSDQPAETIHRFTLYLIQPLLDPVVASKFVFTRNNAELHKVVPRERLPIIHYEGLDDWKYQYVPSQEGENDCMKDHAKKEELLAERHAIEARFDAVTRTWIKSADGKNNVERDDIAKEFREQYTRMSPYIRATSLYKRWGVAVNGEVNWTYNVKAE
ncbi:hypothetical protein BGX24_005694 [Mortierella sp. AD032]|nr:hypothetical protein BGX24_005694 [Mortierella sp. AD032]